MVSWWNYMYAKLAHNMVSPLLFSHILTHWQANPGNFVTLKPGYTCTCMLQLQQVSCRVLSDILSDCCSDCHMFDFSCIFSIIIACIFIKKFPGDLGHSWNLQTFFFYYLPGLLHSSYLTLFTLWRNMTLEGKMSWISPSKTRTEIDRNWWGNSTFWKRLAIIKSSLLAENKTLATTTWMYLPSHHQSQSKLDETLHLFWLEECEVKVVTIHQLFNHCSCLWRAMFLACKESLVW